MDATHADPPPRFRLGYLVPEFPRQTHIFFWRECEQLRRRGVEPAFLSTRRPPAEACPHAFRERATAATHYVFPPPFSSLLGLLRRPRGLARALRYWLAVGASPKLLGVLLCAGHLVDHCRRRGITHIHVHSCGQSAILAAMVQRLGGPGYSLTLHNPLHVHGPHQPRKWKYARFAIVITQQLLEEVQREIGPDRPPTYVAPMGVDLEAFRRTRPYEPASGPTVRLFSCGRLHPCKGHDVLIRAVGLLRVRGLDARLTIAGEDADSGNGQFRRDLESLVADLTLGEFVQLPGAISEEAVRGELEIAHVFALASESEPLGVVIMEAMAMGLPVVTTAAGGTNELVTDGLQGRRVPPGDPAALAEAVREIVAFPALARRMGEAGRRHVESAFGSDRSAATIVQGLADQGLMK